MVDIIVVLFFRMYGVMRGVEKNACEGAVGALVYPIFTSAYDGDVFSQMSQFV